jgi:lysophospholipase L1-like esterase
MERTDDVRSLNRRVLVAIGAAVAVGVTAVQAVAEGSGGAPQRQPYQGWVGTWQASATGTTPKTDKGYPGYSIRNVVHTSVGGPQARIRLTNALGTVPVLMGHVTVAAGSGGAAAVPGTMREVTFGGVKSITIAAGAEVLSDPVDLNVPEDGDLLVTMFTPEPSGPVTYHQVANETSFLTPDGDHTAEETGTAFTAKTQSWQYVAGVDVRGGWASGSVVTLGDSITDGNRSTAGADLRWPDQLADRLKTEPGPTRLGVLNAGISSNRLLSNTWNPNALSRLNRDVLTATGARTVIVLEGINDIGAPPQHHEPAPIIEGLRQVAAQVHAQGLRVIGGTITPFGASSNYTEELEGVRLAVNDFIRNGGVFDSGVDFDAALRDPADPHRLRAEFDSGDHLHPNDAGYGAMAQAVNLRAL